MQRQYRGSRGMLVAILMYVLLFTGCTKATPVPALTGTPTVTGTLAPIAPPAVTLVPTESPVTPTPTLEPQAGTIPTPAYTVTLRIGWLEAPAPLNPFAEQPSQADTILALIYDRLIYRTLDNVYAPAFAKGWTSPDSGKTWVFSLQPDVKTHDGQPFTAQDVAFTLQLYQGYPQFSYYGGYTTVVQKIEATDSSTLVITVTRPVGNIEALVHWIPLLPKHIWETREISRAAEMDQGKWIGTGPFIMEEYRPGERVTLSANKGYWMGTPKVDAVTFRTYPNADALVRALKSGEVDLITAVPAHLINDLKADPRIQVLSGPQIHVRSLLFNVCNKAQSTGHPALRDPQVRLAIAHAVDKQQIIDLTLQGQGMHGLSIIPPALHKWFNPGIQDVEFDLQKAQEILDSAAYTDSNDDGLREMPGSSRPLDFRLSIPSDSGTDSRAAEMIGNWLRQIGIKVTPQTVGAETLKAARCPACDYDMLLWEQDGGPDPGWLLSTLTTAQVETGINQTGYSNALYDALYEQQANAIDQEQRRQIVWRMQEIAFNDRPCIVLYYALAVQAYRRDRFDNWLFIPNGNLSLTDERSLLQVKPAP